MIPSPSTRGRLPVASLVAVALLGALCGVALRVVIDGSGVVAVATATAVLTTLAVALCSRVRSSQPATALVAGIATVVIVVVAVAWQTKDTADSLGGAIVDGIVHGWSDLATTPTPSELSARLAVPIALAVGVSCVAGAIMSTSTTARIGPVLPGATAVVGACIAAGGSGHAAALLGVGLVASFALHLVGRRAAPTATTRVAGWAPVTLSVGAVAVGAVAMAPLVGVAVDDENAFDPRDRFDPPTVPTDVIDPIDQLALLRQRPDTVLAIVESDGAAPIRLTTLDRYDGARWSTSSKYRRFGRVIDAPARTNVLTRPVSLDVEIVDLDGLWLPSVADPESLAGIDALVDPDTGTFIAVDETLSDGVAVAAADRAYRIVANVPDPSVEVLRAGLPVARLAAATSLAQPVPEELTSLANDVTAGAPSAFDVAILLSDHLGRTVNADRSLPGGASYGQLVRALLETGSANDVQVATAFAVLARSVGLPTRLAIGFDPEAVPDAGRHELTAADLRIWPEIAFDDVGWVPFRLASSSSGESSVLVGAGGDQRVVVEDPVPQSQTIGRSDDPADPSRDSTPIRAVDPSVAAESSSGALGRLIAVVLAVPALLVAAGLAVTVMKRRRTQRRRADAATADDAVLAAWADVVERLLERDPARHDFDRLTLEDVVARDETITPALAGLYDPVQRALYGGPVRPVDAERAWAARDRLVRRIAETSPLHARVRRCVDPRPLTRRRRRRGPDGETTPVEVGGLR